MVEHTNGDTEFRKKDLGDAPEVDEVLFALRQLGVLQHPDIDDVSVSLSLVTRIEEQIDKDRRASEREHEPRTSPDLVDGLRVYVLSPYRGDVVANKAYARRCLFDSLSRGENPFIAHLFYPNFLDDGDPEQRKRSMRAARAWLRSAHLAAVYRDRGLSDGMRDEIELAESLGITITYRELPEDLQ